MPFWVQTDPPSHTRYKIYQAAPKVLRFKRSLLRELMSAPEGAAIHVTDAEGQVFSVNEVGFRTRADLPPITDSAYFEIVKKLATTDTRVSDPR